MKLALALLLPLLFLASPAFAWNEPDGVRGVPWGTTQEELRVKVQQAGDTLRCDSPEICVSLRARFGPVPVNITYLFPKDGKFEMAILTFRPGDYKKVRAAFVEQYGAPMSAREEDTRGLGCAMGTNEIVEWSGERVVIDLRRFASTTEGRATITLKALRDREPAITDGGPEKEPKEQG